jgi:predicted nucleic acid-binding protein
MNKIFVDTGAFFSLQAEDDSHHREAKGIFPTLLTSYRNLATSNQVLAETYTLLRMTKSFAAAWKFLEIIEASPRIEVVFSTKSIEEEALKILSRFSDHAFSFVDGTSFAIMKREKISHAFAFDIHFKIAGFLRVPQDHKV